MTPKDLGLRCVCQFPAPQLYNDGLISGFISAAQAEFSSYGFGPQNVSKIEGDRLFSYVVSISLFNGNAGFILGRDSLQINILNGQTLRDVALIKELLDKGLNCVPNLKGFTLRMAATCHAVFPDETDVEKYFKTIVIADGPVRQTGATVMSADPGEAMLQPGDRTRLDLAISEVHRNAVFMAYHFTTQHLPTKEFWDGLSPKLDSLAGSFGVDVVPLPP